MTLTVIHKNPICSFNASWLQGIVDQYLAFELWDPQKTYPKNTLFYLNCGDFCDQAGYDFCTQLNEQGFRVIVDNLWEVNPGPIPGALRICCDRWFWYNESLWYQHLNYQSYRPQHNIRFRALMPMNRRKPHRDEFLAQVDTDDLMWSYVETGVQLPWDRDMSNWDAQRYMNPDWYNQTYMSMVVESLVRPGSKYTPCFVTEKTFKPIAFQHPFLVYGNRGTLRQLREWGFVTWDNLWDESYDEIVDVTARRQAVTDILNHVQPCEHTAETKQRLEHNHNRFFDTGLVHTGIIKDILEPILEYAETNL